MGVEHLTCTYSYIVQVANYLIVTQQGDKKFFFLPFVSPNVSHVKPLVLTTYWDLVGIYWVTYEYDTLTSGIRWTMDTLMYSLGTIINIESLFDIYKHAVAGKYFSPEKK